MYKDLEELVVNQGKFYNGEGFTQKLPTGIITLDIALGGGYPLNGSVCEIYGEESHGKTTMAYRISMSCTKSGGYVTWVDSELSYSPEWAEVQGVDTSRVIPYRPYCMEEANEIILNDIKRYKETFMPWKVDNKWKPTQKDAEEAGVGISNVDAIKEFKEANAPSHIIVWDSLAAAPVRSVADAEGDFKEGMAYRARLIKSFLSRYQVHAEGCSKISMILVNQVIDNIGDMFGPAITTPGGRGLRHGKHLAIYVKKAGSGEKDQDQFVITDYVKLAITKNKVTPVLASFPVLFSKSKGYIGATALLEYLMDINWFKSAGSWKKFDYNRIDLETGEVITEEISIQRGSFYKLIEQRPELFRYLCEKVKELFVSKFPMNKSLSNTDISAIINACLEEDTALPSEEEVSSENVEE
jgi:recombination protein RecA